jgi:hypothetical protein
MQKVMGTFEFSVLVLYHMTPYIINPLIQPLEVNINWSVAESARFSPLSHLSGGLIH